MAFLDRVAALFSRGAKQEPANLPAGHHVRPSSEIGHRSTPESEWQALNRSLWVDPELRQAILDLRTMDRVDPRVKKIHNRASRSAAKGGLMLRAAPTSKRLHKEFKRWHDRMQLGVPAKLQSDLRGLMMEGQLPMQWVYDDTGAMIAGVRMPSETIVPQTSPNGRITDPAKAYVQFDLISGRPVAEFALYQLTVGRLTPGNYDDWGSLGRPYLDATRGVWKKLIKTESDMVIRRAMRAPQRMAHVLEGADEATLLRYKTEVEQDQAHGNVRDYFLNRKGSIAPVGGDANLDHIADVAYLLDTFFAGAPAPKGLFGYVGDLSRDVLEDLKRDYYEELDALQDDTAIVYTQGFKIHMLLLGMNPENFEFEVGFAERLTDSRNQRADLALKFQALGASRDTIWDAAGLDASAELEKVEAQAKETAAYPEEGLAGPPLENDDDEPGAPNVSITPSNARKGESATTISTRGTV